jgi:hypothetical protein
MACGIVGAAALAILMPGCSGQATSPVEGVVLLDGKPLAGASVQLVPQGEGRDATAQTDAQGRFRVSTFRPGDGALPGTYKVVISPPIGTPDPTQYASADEAMAAAARPAPKPAGPPFPEKYTRPDQTPLTIQVPLDKPLRLELTR